MLLTARTQSMTLDRFWKVKSMQIIRNLIAHDIPSTKSQVKIDRAGRTAHERFPQFPFDQISHRKGFIHFPGTVPGQCHRA
jgi:hypothetical protein